MRRRSLFQLFFSFTLAPLVCVAASAASLPSAASFFKDPAVRSVQLSPQSHDVALVMTMDDGEQKLAVRDTTEKTEYSSVRSGQQSNRGDPLD